MEKDNAMRKQAENNNSFGFPLNIKQMGNVDKEVKIYIEDYVYTYIYRYAKTKAKTEKLAVLVGRYYRVDGQDTLVISGAIQGKYTENENGNEVFTDEAWEYISQQMEKYFPELSIVGWVRVQPEYGTFMMAKDEKFHMECFSNNWQVFFVVDPVEMQDSIYCINSGKNGMRRVKGYFIYYDKNESMQDYMIENSICEPKSEIEEDDDFENDSSGKTAVQRLLGITERKREFSEKEDKPYKPDRIDAAAKIRSIMNKKEEEKKENKNREGVISIVCMALTVACLAMGASIIKERDRLIYLEKEILNMKTSYTAMSEKVEDTTLQVFSMKNSNIKPKEEENDNDEVETSYKEYTIEEGDSLWYICRKFYNGENKIEEIKKFNDIENENILQVGSIIKLP